MEDCVCAMPVCTETPVVLSRVRSRSRMCASVRGDELGWRVWHEEPPGRVRANVTIRWLDQREDEK